MKETSGRIFPGSFFPAVEEALCWLSLLLLALLPIVDAVLRVVFKSGFPDASGLLIHLLLILGLLSGMLTTKNQNHLCIAVAGNFAPENVKRFFSICTNTFSAFVTTVFAWASISFIRIGLMGRLISGIIPDRIFALIIPLGFMIIALRFARLAPLKGAARIIPFFALVLGTFFSLPVIAKAVWGFDIPEIFYSLSEFFHLLAWYIKIPGIIVLILAAFAGMPLFTVMGGIALLLIEASWGEIDVAANQVYTALTQESIAPIPLFTIAGFFLSESKAGERLVKTFRSFFGWFPGGMIIVTVVICAFFTSFTGASGVTILALGGLLYTILSEHMKYPERFSIGLLTSTGSIGLLFPPSLPIILVGATTMTSIAKLFAGGIIPGIILVAAVSVFGIAVSVKMKTGKNPEAGGLLAAEPFHIKSALRNLWDSIFEILLPVFLLSAFFSGLLSITELGAVALLYVFIVEVFIHRDIPLRELPAVFRRAIPIIGGVLSIIALSMSLSYYIIDSQVPEAFALWLRTTIESRVIFLLLLNVSLLIVGCLMDIFSAILIVLPLVSPLGQAYGIDPVHLGIIFLINLEVGFLTPPVGLNLFLASYRFEKPFTRICRYVLPFLIIQLAVVLLVTYVPALSTFLPRFF
jgi:tripartite ATP-independent transporter DctM subunit